MLRRTCVIALAGAAVAGCSFTPPQRTPATWLDERWGGVTQQELDNSCGLASLVTIMHHHFGEEITERDLLTYYLASTEAEAIAEAMRSGLSLLELDRLAHGRGFATRRAMFTFDELARITQFAPVLVYLDVAGFRHFAVVRGIGEHEVLLADSSRGNVRYSHEAFMGEWRAPDSLLDQWERPGGLVLFREGDAVEAMIGTLLSTPVSSTPESFYTLRRGMLLGR